MKLFASSYLILSLLASLSYPVFEINLNVNLLAQSPSTQPSRQPPPNTEDFPSVPKNPPPLPNNKTRPGGGLSQEPNTCQVQQGQVTALIPESNQPHAPLTLADPFTLFFYLPDDASQIKKVEFWINTQDQKGRIVPKTSILLANASGIIGLTLSKELQTDLETGKNYQWHLKVYCQNETSIALNGWFQTVTDSQENRWHDALADTGKKLSQNPDNSTIRAEWKRLLEQISASELANQSIDFIELQSS